MTSAADRVEQALAEGRIQAAADILEAIGVTVVDSKDYAAVQTALRALGKPRRRR